MPRWSSSPSLASLATYRQAEKGYATDIEGNLYEHQVYELRIHPPNVAVDNVSFPDRTVLTVDSANRPGTLVEVVQCLTEMGLSIRKARISSDGGWFVDEFVVDRVTDTKRLQAIKDVLSAGPSTDQLISEEQTVFELAGTDQGGLLADIVALLENNNCLVQSLALWTHNKRVACVISVRDKGALVGVDGMAVCTNTDAVKSTRLKQLLCRMLDSTCEGDAIVEVSSVRGLIHHERRLHQLLLKEEAQNWSRSNLSAEYEQLVACAPPRPPSCPPVPSSVITCESQGSHVDGTGPSPPHSQGFSQKHAPTNAPTAGGACVAAAPCPRKSNLSRASGCSSMEQICDPQAQASQPPSPQGHTPEARGAVVGEEGSAGIGAKDSHSQCPHSPPNPHWSASMMERKEGEEERGASAGVQQPLSTSLPTPLMGYSQTQGTLDGVNLALSSLSLPDTVGMHLPPSAAASSSDSRAVSGSGACAHAAGCNSSSCSGGASCMAKAPPQNAAALAAARKGGALVGPQLLSPKASKPHIHIANEPRRGYWLVSIYCKDRMKLLFDTLCTLADLDYDVYHASVDIEGDWVEQQYYVRVRSGDCAWNVERAGRLRYMLEASIQRRHPKGIKVHIQSGHAYDLSALTAAWRQAGLWITRAKAAPSSGLARFGTGPPRGFDNTFYVLDKSGCAPDVSLLQRTCISQGGKPLNLLLKPVPLQQQQQLSQQPQQPKDILQQQAALHAHLLHIQQQQRMQGWAGDQVARAISANSYLAPAAGVGTQNGLQGAVGGVQGSQVHPQQQQEQQQQQQQPPLTTATLTSDAGQLQFQGGHPAGMVPAGMPGAPAFAFAVQQRGSSAAGGSGCSSVASSM